jgi:hypothetical protein
MAKKKSKSIVKVEVSLPDRANAEAEFKRTIARLVEQKVSEAMSSGSDALFQPWFQPREIAYEIKRRQTVTEQHKWIEYFRKYGCIVCSPIARSHERPVYVDAEKFAELRKQGLDLRKIAKQLGVGYSTAQSFSKGNEGFERPKASRPEASEIGEGPAHRSLGLCTTCYRGIANRLEGILREHAPAHDRIQLNFMDSVRLAQEALAPSLEALSGPRGAGKKLTTT